MSMNVSFDGGKTWISENDMSAIDHEIQKIKETLSQSGVMAIDRITQNRHTDMPIGTRILEVSDPKSVANLEKSWAQMGIELPAHRFDIYKNPQILKQGGR